MRRDAYVSFTGCFSCPLEWCCPCGGLYLLVWGVCVCVCVCVWRSYDSCVLTDPPTLICIKHNGDEEPEEHIHIISHVR
jgi:hypothetical protein